MNDIQNLKKTFTLEILLLQQNENIMDQYIKYVIERLRESKQNVQHTEIAIKYLLAVLPREKYERLYMIFNIITSEEFQEDILLNYPVGLRRQIVYNFLGLLSSELYNFNLRINQYTLDKKIIIHVSECHSSL
jgi:hypothetical protein